MTHEQLRKRAIQWLTNTQHCGVVLSEMVVVMDCMQIPDAIGFQTQCAESISVLVECKVSQSDYLANANKAAMSVPHLSVGHFRWFMVPKGLVGPGEHKERYPGYGLLYAGDKTGPIRSVVHSERFESHRDTEVRMLVSALRRVQVRGFLVVVREGDAETGAAEIQEPAA